MTRRQTHSEQILAVLADGQWHTSAEIYSRVFCVLHSRISHLRRVGYRIEHRGGGAVTANHEYRWLLNVPDARRDAKGSSRTAPVLPVSGTLSSEAA